MIDFAPLLLKPLMQREERAIDNLAKIASAVEHMRMADVRGIDDILALLYRQTHPAPAPQAPPPSSAPQIPAPYRVLGVLPGAPLPVIEAAYRAMARLHHPDAGGDAERMKAVNAAMEVIRKEYA